jgi:hypothetical protein
VILEKINSTTKKLHRVSTLLVLTPTKNIFYPVPQISPQLEIGVNHPSVPDIFPVIAPYLITLRLSVSSFLSQDMFSILLTISVCPLPRLVVILPVMVSLLFAFFFEIRIPRFTSASIDGISVS